MSFKRLRAKTFICFLIFSSLLRRGSTKVVSDYLKEFKTAALPEEGNTATDPPWMFRPGRVILFHIDFTYSGNQLQSRRKLRWRICLLNRHRKNDAIIYYFIVVVFKVCVGMIF